MNKKRDRDNFEDNNNNIGINNNNSSNSNNNSVNSNNNFVLNASNNNNSNNNNNINNNSSSSNEIKLNPFIFNDILPLIIFKCQFKRLLELSLISKSIFNSIQNYLTNQQDAIRFYPYDYQILEYIKTSNDGRSSGSGYNYSYSIQYDEEFDSKKEDNTIESNDSDGIICNENYKLKLIQFKNISTLYLKKKFKKLTQLRSELIKYCGSKLKVYVVNYIYISPSSLNIFLGGFFKFKKLFTYWDSNEDIGEENRDDNGDNMFPFQHLNFINPKKLKLSISTPHDRDMNFHLSSFGNKLKYTSLESIKFEYYSLIVGDQIVNMALSSTSPSLKEFTCRPRSGKSVARRLLESIIKDNKSIRKLILRRRIYGSDDITDPSYTLNQLIGNTSLRTLGLELYLIYEDEYQSLSILKQIPNISKLYCDYDSVVAFLSHCNENPNIKTLHIKNIQDNYSGINDDDYSGKDKKYFNEIPKYFSKFITQNQSLECIKITACYDLYERLQSILNKSNSNNNNNHNHLIIKRSYK